MLTSGLWTRAQPGGRKRSGQAESGGLDGRRERQASEYGYPRATDCPYQPEPLHGKHGHPARLSLGRSYAKPRFADERWCSFAASCRGKASGCQPPLVCHWTFSAVKTLTSERMLMPTSGLRTQAKPGGRERSERAVNGGQDGRRERPTSGHEHSRASDYPHQPEPLPGKHEHPGRSRRSPSPRNRLGTARKNFPHSYSHKGSQARCPACQRPQV